LKTLLLNIFVVMFIALLSLAQMIYLTQEKRKQQNKNKRAKKRRNEL